MDGGRGLLGWAFSTSWTLTVFGFVANLAFSCSKRAKSKAVDYVHHLRSAKTLQNAESRGNGLRVMTKKRTYIISLFVFGLFIFRLFQLRPVDFLGI